LLHQQLGSFWLYQQRLAQLLWRFLCLLIGLEFFAFDLLGRLHFQSKLEIDFVVPVYQKPFQQKTPEENLLAP
jgi:hypothetical protein